MSQTEAFKCSCGCTEYKPVHVVGGVDQRRCKDCGAEQSIGW